MTLTWGPADNRELILHFFYRTSSIIDQKKAGSEDIDGMMRRIDDLFAREKRKAATGKTDADYAKLPLLMKFEDRARYVQDTYRTSSVCVYVRLYVLGSRDPCLTIFISLVSVMQTQGILIVCKPRFSQLPPGPLWTLQPLGEEGGTVTTRKEGTRTTLAQSCQPPSCPSWIPSRGSR